VPIRFAEPLPLSMTTLDGYADVVSIDELPDTFYARAEIDILPGTTETGLLLRATADGDRSYVLRLEPRRGRVVFDRWPREKTGDAQWHVSGDVPFEIELERPCVLEPGPHTIEVIVDDDILVAVIDRTVTLSTRIYGHPDGRLGFFAGEGGATLQALTVHQRAETLHQ
jgi:beta-fructofuranosidase